MAAEDPNHPNPYMFTGRRFDIEIGLYYYRARYYDPFIGRFLQTDPVGYEDGMNWYAYCNNNPLAFVDPTGLLKIIWAGGLTKEQKCGVEYAIEFVRDIAAERVREINRLLGSMNCETHSRSDCNATKELEAAREVLRGIRDAIDDPNFKVRIQGKDLGDDSDLNAYYKNPEIRNYWTHTITYNTNPTSGQAFDDSLQTAHTTMDELSHIFGTEHEPRIDSLKGNNADNIARLVYGPISDTAWYRFLRRECFKEKGKGKGEPNDPNGGWWCLL